MKSFNNIVQLRNTKAAIVGASIAIITLAGAYFNNEFKQENIITTVTKPTEVIQSEEQYFNQLDYENDLSFNESAKLKR